MASIHDLRQSLALYLVTDDASTPEQLLATVRSALEGGVTSVQLRRKHDDGGRLVELGYGIRELTRSFGALYIVNDRVDIALLSQADGIHVGQSDISCRDARTLLGDKLIGVSTCTLEEAKIAEQDGADYLGVGAVFPTRSKSDADMCGIDGLAAITRSVSIPVVGIGGITLNNLKSVVEAGADGVAVVSAIVHAEDPRRASVELKQLLG